MGNFMGGFGGGNLQNLMKQAQMMQKNIETIKEKIANTEFLGKCQGDLVTVTLSGERKIKQIKIKPEIVDKDDIEMLEDLVCVAVNDGLLKIEQMEKELLPKVPGM